MPEKTKFRLSKLMSERGLCSRREAEDYIRAGQVLVNGQCETNVAATFSRDCQIFLQASSSSSKISIMLHKPIGVVSAQPEVGKIPAIRLLTGSNHWPSAIKPLTAAEQAGLAVCGRLDEDSRGLLLFSQDGRVAKALIGADSQVSKEYLVEVKGEITEEKLARLRFGLHLDGRPLKAAEVVQLAAQKLRFVLQEGKKRQIRRMCGLVGLTVVDLWRVRIGELRLADLPAGRWRHLTSAEVAALLSLRLPTR
jgi:23S rRNA pseudouridine2604 synthase